MKLAIWMELVINKWQSWNAGSCGTSNQTSGWNSKGWSQPTEAKDVGGNERNNGGSTDASGGRQWSSWAKSTIAMEIKETNQGGGWNSGTKSSTHSGGWNKQDLGSGARTSGWNKGTVSMNEAGESRGNNWGSTDASGGNQWGKLAIATEIKETNQQGGGWNNQDSGCNQGTSTEIRGDGGNKTWGHSNAADRVQTSSWNQSKDVKRESNRDENPTDSWDKATPSFGEREMIGMAKEGGLNRRRWSRLGCI